jgi:glycosidase
MNRLLLVTAGLLLASPPLSAQNFLYEDVYWQDQPGRLVLGNAAWRVEVGKNTGNWEVLALTSGQNLLRAGAEPTLNVRLDGQPLLTGQPARVTAYRVSVDRQRRGVHLDVTLAAGDDHELTTRYTLFPGETRLRRSATLTRRWGPGTATKLDYFRFLIPSPLLGDPKTCVVDVPGPFFPKTYTRPGTPYDSLVNRKIGFHSAPDAGFGVLSLSNPGASQTLAAWMDTGGETNYRPFAIGDGKTVSFAHENYRYTRLLPGQSVQSDEQEIVLASGLGPALDQYRRMVNATMPLDPKNPDWVRDAVILEIYPKYFKEGFRGIAEKLLFYRRVGVNVVYLMPHWLGGYSPLDPFAVDPKLGTEADLKALVKTAHDLGMRVVFDMVIHGFNRKSAVPKQRPDLFVKAESGDTLAYHPTWGSITTDWAAPAYQRYMADLVTHDLTTYGIDGYRVDAASYKGPGWNAALPYPAYRPGAAAPELMRAMLDALRARKPDAMLLSEVFGPVFYSVSNFGHDNQTEGVPVLLERMARGQYTAADYQQHLANVLAMLPAGANRVFYARNHDTSWFYHFDGYTPRFMAFEAVHALVGIPEIFAGDPDYKANPDDDPATFETYRKLFALRRQRPELTRGEARLRDVTSNNPMIFSAVKSVPGHSSLVLISMSDREETARVTMGNQQLPALVEFTDPISGQVFKANPATVKLKPFQVLVGKVE